MRTLSEILNGKLASVSLNRQDLMLEQDDSTWREKHPTGPVHIQIKCLCCDSVIASDLPEYGWLEKDSFWKSKIVPHLETHA